MNNRNNIIETIYRISDTIESRKPQKGFDNKNSYVNNLLIKGPDSFLKKIGEEATELVMAAKDGLPERIISETADLWFHCLVLLTYYNLRPEDVMIELQRREGISGIEEKSLRDTNKK